MLLKIRPLIYTVLILTISFAIGSQLIPPVKKILIAKGIELFTQKFGQNLEVNDVDLIFPFEIKLSKPRILTLDGNKLFEASKVSIRISPYSFFSDELHIHTLIFEDPLLHMSSTNEPTSPEGMFAFLPTNTVIVNQLKLIRYQIPKEWEDGIAGLYDIDAKIEYNPDEEFASISAKATKSDNSEHSLEVNCSLFADEDLGFLAFEVVKTKGLFEGISAEAEGRLSGNFSGLLSDWKEFFQNPLMHSTSSLNGTFRSQGRIFNNKVSVSASMELEKGLLLKLNNLEVKTPIFSLQSSFTLSTSGSLDMQGSVKIDDMAKILALGNIQSTLEEAALINFHLNGQTDFASYTDFNDLKFDLPWGSIAGNFSWEKSLGFAAKIKGHNSTFDIDLDAKSNAPFMVKLKSHDQSFSCTGTLKTLTPEMLSADIDQLTANLGNEQLLLEAPFSLETDFNSLNMSPLHLSLKDGSITAKAHMQDEFWRFSLNFKKIPCNIFTFKEFFDHQLEGHVDGEALFYGKADELQGTAKIDVHDLFIKEDERKGIPLIKSSISATFQNHKMDCQGTFSGIGEAPLNFECCIPVLLSIKNPLVTIEKNTPFTAEMNAEGSLTPLIELFILDTASFAADGKINMKAYGTLADPKFDGTFKLRNGMFEIYDLGTTITDIEADIKASGRSLELTRLQGSDGLGGLFSGSGSVVFSKKDGFPFRFDIHLNQARPMQIDLFKGSANGLLSWHGTLDKSLVEGELDILSGTLQLPKKIPQGTVSYPVHYINSDQNERKPTEIVAEGKHDSPIELKIQLATRQPLIITDEGLNSSWKGKVNLQGNIQKPQITGEIKLDSGDYILNGKRFSLSQGRISFNGDIEKKSNLYVSLSREISGYDVEIILKGLLKDPDILLQSHPSLPKQQVLSLILFGRTSSDISELQEEQLEQSLSNLTKSSSQKEGVLTKFQKSLGIDHIDVMPSNDTSSEVRIRLSKYITRGVCVSVSRDVGEDINAISLEAEINKNFKAQVEAQDNAQGQVSIFWKKNY